MRVEAGALDATARDTTARDGAGFSESLASGSLVGRYVVLARLGQGAMGVVYAAYDRDLDRKVAIKLLQSHQDSPDQHTRILREAQAMAQLAHRAVVGVHDVGTLDGRVWIAMEFVDGRILTDWLAERRREWPEVLRVFTRAAEGLQAAHAAGLVHRDFKPDNVMVDRDGGARVMDFGLARADGPITARELPDGLRPGGVLDLSVTHAGALIGTPLYMAPEQWHGAVADARSDQFAFCVALWSALHGAPPFRGTTVVELCRAVTEGQPEPPPRGSRVPRWLHRIVRRGLAVDPAQRFPSMHALLATIDRGRAGARARRVLVGLGLVGLVALAVGLWQRHDRARRVAACEAAGAEIADVWTPARQDGLRAALAPATVERFAPWIDRWTRRWSDVRSAGCLAATVERTRDPQLAARADACLDDRRDELAALLDALVDAPSAERDAVPAAARLTPPEPCDDAAALARRPPVPDAVDARARTLALRRELMALHGLFAAAAFDAAVPRAEALIAAAAGHDDAALVAEAEVLLGRLTARTGDLARSESALTHAYVAAATLGADEIAADAGLLLMFTVGYLAARPPEGLVWSRPVEALVERLDRGQDPRRGNFLLCLAAIHTAQGNYREARALLERAVVVRTEALGPGHPDVAVAYNNLGNLLGSTGDWQAARAAHRHALELREAALGPDHPDVAMSLGNLANVEEETGDWQAALAMHERALALRRRTLGEGHADVGRVLVNLAFLHASRGDLARARDLDLEARTILERALGPSHPDVALPLGHLGTVYRQLGELDEAESTLRQALALREAALGDHPESAHILGTLGEIQLARGAPQAALPLLERAVALAGRDDGPPSALAFARFQLARALVELPAAAGRDPARARLLAEQAAAYYRGDGKRDPDAARLEAWLLAHP